MTINLGLLGSLLFLAWLFAGLLLANKVTNFGASGHSLAVVTIIAYVIALIPVIGGIAAIIVLYIMLKKISPEGPVIYTMLVSVLITIFVGALFNSFFS